MADSDTRSERLLTAVLDSLCNLAVRLNCALPNLCDMQDATSRRSYHSPESEKQLNSTSPSDNGSASPQHGQLDQYPVLVEHMLYCSQVEGHAFFHRSWRSVLDRLLSIAAGPVRQALNNQSVSWSDQLVRHACRLLARIVAELAAQACCTDVSFPLLYIIIKCFFTDTV